MTDDRRQRAVQIILELLAFGLSQAHIAEGIVAADATISHILEEHRKEQRQVAATNIRRMTNAGRAVTKWPVSEALLSRLEILLAAEKAKHEEDLRSFLVARICQLPKTIATCNHAGVATGSELLDALNQTLSGYLIAMCTGDTKAPQPLPNGIDAASAYVMLPGENPTRLFLIAVREPSVPSIDTVSALKQLIAHEVEHVVECLQPNGQASNHKAKSAY